MAAVLYSFRRCPYAIRARYVLALVGLRVVVREVVLKSKPEALLRLGGRSSVPQLIDCDGQRYPESLDIIFWALKHSSNDKLKEALWCPKSVRQNKIMAWIHYNDRFFKHWLDRYKYADRYPEQTEVYYRQQGERFLRRLEKRLAHSRYLLADGMSLADVCLFPFVRQFAAVNGQWFESSEYFSVKSWLSSFVGSDLFQRVMTKWSAWEEGQEPVYFPPEKVEG
ncbi:glutaredoxin 2 [Marinomonas spartinae]|uniref:Glutaredoxin 2 n=1 Tax=Marinomonas spartinae TaxID=1792290 RepID=A0A1A8TKQ8_9GAMM|nr:glutathione S-transferase [Marinomonas spartinae]SBS32944.1 glutaredoxin 2 [Marinomonas spartinae]